ncbi:MAG: ATP phosphoribosyltransferase regulatory subunit [Chromatiales bacterium]
MTHQERWLLPEGIEEVLPPQAERLEALRRTILDLFRSWGYELVMPPFVEYLESLLTGTGRDLDLQTFKLIDQLTGRTMGVRADMTPQVARIDARRVNRRSPTRLCYLGTVLHARPGRLNSGRSPLQVGAELYGHAGIESDVEIIRLMLETLAAAGIRQVYLDLGHMGVFRGLARHAALDAEQEGVLFELLQRKAAAELAESLRDWKVTGRAGDMIMALTEFNGDADVLEEARPRLRGAPAGVARALAALRDIVAALRRQVPGLRLHVDLAELRGYHYHTGVMFAAYQPASGQALALGGRYDDIGKVFGRARPATGFSTDLRQLAAYASAAQGGRRRILAPAVDDRGLRATVDRLRGRGEIVVSELSRQQGDVAAMGCDWRLARIAGQWKVVKA